MIPSGISLRRRSAARIQANQIADSLIADPDDCLRDTLATRWGMGDAFENRTETRAGATRFGRFPRGRLPRLDQRSYGAVGEKKGEKELGWRHSPTRLTRPV